MSATTTTFPSKIQELAYELNVQDAMCRDLLTVSPDTTMSEVREIFRQKRISGLPVVEHGQMVGIISLENFITCILRGGIQQAVRENMSAQVHSLYADEPLVQAVQKFEASGYGRFPVIDRETAALVGILTKGDVISCLLNRLNRSYQQEELQTYRASHLFDDLPSDRTKLLLRYVVPGGDYKLAGKQSANLKVNLLRLGIAPPIVRRVIVAACEAEMNIIVFTSGGELMASIEPDKITVNAIDHGPGIPDIDLAMQPGYSTAPAWAREMGFGAGMGLPNIKSFTDAMRIDSVVGEGTNLEFVVLLTK